MNSKEYAIQAINTRDYTSYLTLDNQDRRLLEASMGLCGETSELWLEYANHYDVDYKDIKNRLILELGDVEWYRQEMLEVLSNIFSISQSEILIDIPYANYELAASPILSALLAASGLLDCVKKHLMYNKPLNQEKTLMWYGCFERAIEDFYLQKTLFEKDRDFLPENVRAKNIEKLQKRYAK